MGALSPQSFRLSDYIRWDCTWGERGERFYNHLSPVPIIQLLFYFSSFVCTECASRHTPFLSFSLRLYPSLRLPSGCARANTHTYAHTNTHAHWLKSYMRVFKHLSTLFKDSNSCQERRTRIFCNRQNWNVTGSHNLTLEMDTSADQISFFLFSSLWLLPFLCLGGWFFLLFINLFFFLFSVWAVWSVFSQGHHWANCCDKGGCLVTPTWSASSFRVCRVAAWHFL